MGSDADDVNRSSDFSIMDRKPIITCAGDKTLFASLEQHLIQAIPLEPTEWRRSYGRPMKSVYTEATFIPFHKDKLPKEGDWHLIRQPILHIYWTECVEVDVYKASVREDIELWLKILHQHGIEDWLVVQVETYDMKRSNKLIPRTTVLDKIRSDFASKHPDRCISVINPIRSESRSAETWRGLLSRIRTLLLLAYDTTLVRFEETIRKQRERRIEPGWSFCSYFLLQEELAFVLEMLGLYDEALVQYDELDALFTQFVLNSSVGESPHWLSSFQGPLETWPGLQLTHKVNQEQRLLLQHGEASLLQFRSYLFARQCAMLLLTFKPWEIARRTLPFLHNCVAELRILEVSCPLGAVACWVFLGCLEVLRTCDQFNDSVQVQAYSRFTASLWAYASEKLKELGELCGLLPGMEPTSEQLHLVVGLSAGMGDVPLSSSGDRAEPTPTDQLKEALSSSEAFKKHYLEFAELAMGTYKHIGRLRLARLIGRDLAAFHQRLGDYQKACLFLDAALQMLESEGWQHLAVETRQELAHCYLKMGDKERYAKTCASLASSEELQMELRNTYLTEMIKALEDLNTDTALVTPFSGAFCLVSVTVLTEKKQIVIGGTVEVAVELTSLLPSSMHCVKAALTVEKFSQVELSKEMNSPSSNTLPSKSSTQDRRTIGGRPTSTQSNVESYKNTLQRSCIVDPRPPNPLLARLSICQCLDYQQDQSLKGAWATIEDVRHFLQRTDSQVKYSKTSASKQSDFSKVLATTNIDIQPGKNTLILKAKITDAGQLRFGQLSLVLCEGRLEFLSSVLNPNTGFEITTEPATVTLSERKNDLLAGIEQEVVLTVNTGSQWINQDTKLLLKSSDGLQTQLKSSIEEPLVKKLEVSLPQAEPFQTLPLFLRVLAELGSQKDNSVLERKVEVNCPWASECEPMVLQFHPPFSSTLRLHTSRCRKFAQVIVTGLNNHLFELQNPNLVPVTDHSEVTLIPLNPVGGQSMAVGGGLNVFLLWELEVPESVSDDSQPIQALFSMQYRSISGLDTTLRQYQCTFDIIDYKTLLVASARVEPAKGNEFCRASNMCHLHLTVERVSQSLQSSLMYEVLVDQTMWAVCGRTTGVVTLDDNQKQTVQLDVMPLISGYLPIPLVRLSKYIPADQKPLYKEGGRRLDVGTGTLQPRREPFSPGQVFNNSKAQQIHVLPSVPPGDNP